MLALFTSETAAEAEQMVNDYISRSTGSYHVTYLQSDNPAVPEHDGKQSLQVTPTLLREHQNQTTSAAISPLTVCAFRCMSPTWATSTLIIPVVMAGVLGIYSLIVAVLLASGSESPALIVSCTAHALIRQSCRLGSVCASRSTLLCWFHRDCLVGAHARLILLKVKTRVQSEAFVRAVICLIASIIAA